MFKNLQALSRDRHQALSFVPNQPYHFASGLMLTPIVVGEAGMIAREYPIVFSRQDRAPPSALLGVREGVNAYVTPSGHWMARYVPAHVRRYPFMLAEGPAPKANGVDERQFTLTFDAEAPHLSDSRGERLFTSEGEPSPVLENVRTVLINLQRDLNRTLQLVERIQEAGLLVERSLTLSSSSGKTFKLDGLRVVDTGKLAALSPEVLHDLHGRGALMLIQAHLISLSNLRDGPLVRDQAPASNPGTSDDTLRFEGIDWSQLRGGSGTTSSH